MIRQFLNSLLLYLNWFALEVRARVPGLKRRADQAGKRILLLVDQFPPAVTGGVHRPLSFAKHAKEFGWEMTVVVGSAPSKVGPVGQELRRMVPPTVEVHDLMITEPPIAWRLIPHLDGGFFKAIQVVREVRKLAPKDTAVIVASGPSFDPFVAGYFLKVFLGVALVLDYRDEWTECPFAFVGTGPFNVWWERRCLAASDLVLFTTTSMMTQALNRFPRLAQAKVRVVENGAAFDEFESDRTDRLPPGNAEARHVTISFVGNLAEHTNPDSFLATLASVLDRRNDLRPKLRLIWVGNKSAEAQTALRSFRHHDVFEYVDQTPRRETFGLMQRSTLLLLIVNQNMDRYRPGKLYDYLASDTPILVYGSKGEAGSIVEELGAGMVVQDRDDQALERAFDEAMEGRTSNRDRAKRQIWIRRHDRRVLAKRLFEALDGLRHR